MTTAIHGPKNVSDSLLSLSKTLSVLLAVSPPQRTIQNVANMTSHTPSKKCQ